MTGWLQLLLVLGALIVLTPPLGHWLYLVFEVPEHPFFARFSRLEHALYARCGINPRQRQGWQSYARALLLFSLFGTAATYGLLRLQASLPLNPRQLPGMDPLLAFNTAVSFATNTNWQAYSGESTLSPLSQMLALTPHNFVSAAVGLAVAVALARGLTASSSTRAREDLGNFWVDTLRGLLYVLLPLSVLAGLVLVGCGVVQTLEAQTIVHPLEGGSQTLALGPVASQEAIKLLGTNGGGFFNANSAHPFENPTPVSNFLSMLLMFLLPGALTFAYGRMARSQRQGWALFGAMSILFLAGAALCYTAEQQGNPALAGLGIDQSAGNLEGKEVRFGVAGSSLFATMTTAAACGAINSQHSSFTPVGGLVTLLNIQLGEVVFGGVGAGLYGMLMMVLLTVFLAGLMVGRTPEYLGKKLEVREVKLLTLYLLLAPLLILLGTALAVVSPSALAARLHAGPHGLTELLYAFTSGAGNNGSAFAGLSANNAWFNLGLGLTMFAGRFGMLVPVLALGGALVGKRVSPPGPGTFPTGSPLFAALLVAVIVVVGALTFFPALSLGPVLESLQALNGEVH